MKRFFTKPLSPRSTPPSSSNTSTTALHNTVPGLQPKYTVPPLPHPCPHEHIEVLVTREGLLLRPHVVGLRHPLTGGVVRVGWGKEGKVEEVLGAATDISAEGMKEGEREDWKLSVIVYGIVGILELTFGASTLTHSCTH
jgi:phosphatidylinositol 4-phosphatase